MNAQEAIAEATKGFLKVAKQNEINQFMTVTIQLNKRNGTWGFMESEIEGPELESGIQRIKLTKQLTSSRESS